MASSLRTLLEKLVADGYVARGELSAATVQRFFKRNPAPAGAGAAAKDRRASPTSRSGSGSS